MYCGKLQPPKIGILRMSLSLTTQDLSDSIPDRFEKLVAYQPEQIALKTTATALSYKAVNQLANRIAHAIVKQLGKEPEPVALLLNHTIPAVATLLATMKAGKFFVPLMLNQPLDRLQSVLADSQARLLITDSANRSMAVRLASEMTWLDIDDLSPDLPDHNLGLSQSSTAIAAIIYTSGSTGQPKGVVTPHIAYLWDAFNRINSGHLSHTDHLSQIAPYLGGAIWSFFNAFLVGARLCLFDMKEAGLAHLKNWLQAEQITHFHIWPTTFRRFVETLSEADQFPDLRLLALGGELVTPQDINLFLHHFCEPTILTISYASSEARVVTVQTITQTTPIAEIVGTVGYPVAKKEILILDEQNQQLGTGEAGQIAVRSPYLSLGYWNNPKLTRQKFLPDPDGGDQRIYLTGDLGRFQPDGCLEHLGRKDFMVKIRGYRVELGGIEAALHNLETIKNAVVVAQDLPQGDKRLVAYIVPRTQPPPTVSELRRNLAMQLPDYMLPAVFVPLDEFPLTTNGKLDRTALPEPSLTRPHLATPFAAARTNLEHKLVDLWQSLFQLDHIGIHDNFFDLGGHSLLLIQFASTLQHSLNINLTLLQLLQNPTIAALATEISSQSHTPKNTLPLKPESNLICLQPAGNKTPLFFIPGGGGGEEEFVAYGQLTRRLSLDRPVYGFLAPGLTGQPVYTETTRMAQDYVQSMRQVQPNGPYLLLGECIGGKMAWEMAHHLHQQGQTVGLLAMLNTKAVHIPHAPNQYRNQTGLPFWWERLGVHLSQFLKPDPHLAKNRWAYAKGRVDTLLSLLHPITDQQRTLRHVRETRAQYSRLLLLHRPTRPYPASVKILATADHYQNSPTLGWQDWVTGDLQVYPMPGQGSTYLRDYADSVVEQLHSCLVGD